MKRILFIALSLLFCLASKGQQTEVSVGMTGLISREVDLSPFLSVKHFLNEVPSQFGLSLRYAQLHFSNSPDEYTPELLALYRFNFDLAGLGWFSDVGPSGLYAFNANPDNTISDFYWGGRIALGGSFRDLVFEVSFLVVANEIMQESFYPVRSRLAIGLGFREYDLNNSVVDFSQLGFGLGYRF